jgi:SAM-dependent methyltransferase
VKSKKTWQQSSTYQILFGNSIIPAYAPFYCRIYLLWRKFLRSIEGSLLKDRYRLRPKQDIYNESNRQLFIGDRKTPLVNKTSTNLKIDLERDDVKSIVFELRELQNILISKGMKFTSAAGSFKSKDYVLDKELNKMWENAWILAHMRPNPEEIVLDLGGASTIFSYYLASKGCRVYCIDNDWGCHGIVYNARYVAKKMKWPIEIYDRDLAKRFPFKDGFFNKVFCVCVLEHLRSPVRQAVMREINRVLKSTGSAGFTFDYDVGRDDSWQDKGIRYMLKETFLNDVLKPSGLEVIGNQNFLDDCPSDFFLGTLFLKKP